jgi:hypothetical protein
MMTRVSQSELLTRLVVSPLPRYSLAVGGEVIKYIYLEHKNKRAPISLLELMRKMIG